MIKIIYFVAMYAMCSVSNVFAQELCEETIESSDALVFNKNLLVFSKSCSSVTIHLKHVGQMPKTAMGHNLVITTAANLDQTALNGMLAGPDNEYVQPNDSNVIAHTKLIGGGEEASINIPSNKLDTEQAYKFFCSFPGHRVSMLGDIKFE